MSDATETASASEAANASDEPPTRVIRPVPRPRPSRGLFGRSWPTVRAGLHVAALTLVVAGIVHIAVVLLVPANAGRDAWAKLADVAPMGRFTIIALPDGRLTRAPPLPGLDPRFGVAACPFDLSAGPISIRAGGGEVSDLPFWSISVYDRLGRSIYSFNDRTAIDGRLDIVLATTPQNARLRDDPPVGTEDAVLVRTDIGQGFALVRAMAPDATWTPKARSYVDSARCETVTLPEPATG